MNSAPRTWYMLESNRTSFRFTTTTVFAGITHMCSCSLCSVSCLLHDITLYLRVARQGSAIHKHRPFVPPPRTAGTLFPFDKLNLHIAITKLTTQSHICLSTLSMPASVPLGGINMRLINVHHLAQQPQPPPPQ